MCSADHGPSVLAFTGSGRLCNWKASGHLKFVHALKSFLTLVSSVSLVM